MQDENVKRCFVITPIGNENTDIRRHIDGIIDQAIYPAIEDKYTISVAHREFEIGSINDRVIKSIYEADLVIANLTTLNPNVMFELAIRYSYGKPAIVIAEKGTKLPFDIVDENTIFYINDPAGANELKNKIKEFEANIKVGKEDYGPVYKALNKIPIYKAVESGKNVSSNDMLAYIIERLDSIERSSYLNGGKNKRFTVVRFAFKGKEVSVESLREIISDMIVRDSVIIDMHLTPSGIDVYFAAGVPQDIIEDSIKQIIDRLMKNGINNINYYYR